MKKTIAYLNTAFQSACITSYVKSRALTHAIVGTAALSSFASHAAGTTLSDMINTSSQQAKAIPDKGPIFCWAAAFLIGCLSAWSMWKRNQEGASSQHSYGKGAAGFVIAAILVSVGFLINTSANSIGAEATTY